VEVAKTEVEEVADGGESGSEGGARHCAPYGSAAVTRGEGKECSRGGCIWGARGRRQVVRQDGGERNPSPQKEGVYGVVLSYFV